MHIVSVIVELVSQFEACIAIWGSLRNLGLASQFTI